MILQDKVWFVTLAGVAAITAIFVWVISRSSATSESAQVVARAYAIRRWLFLALLASGLIITGVTLMPFPIPGQGAPLRASQVVKVTGHQWAWEVSPAPIKAGVPVEFDVTSADVNHGFAIYDSNDRLLAQTQAMPGVTNRLVHTFAQPGKYRVLCLEYCGLAHHAMVWEFSVIESPEVRP